jgi:hypothetical protein
MMGATTAVEPRNDIERLLQDMVGSRNVELSVASGDGFFSVHLAGMAKETPRCDCHQELWITETNGWTLYARLGDTRQVRFVREPDGHAPERETLSVRLIGPNGGSLLKGSFKPLYDEQNQPIAAQFARWEELRAKYGGRDEVPVVAGALAV